MRWFLCLVWIPLPILAVLQPEVATGFIKKDPACSSRMMVASANPYASSAGIEILKEGGNAIDAAIAMAMVLNVVEPQSSGIGGGGFLLYYRKKDRKVIAYDGRETAPSRIDCSFLQGKELAQEDILGGCSVGVPGLLRMLELAHREEGELPWKRLFDDAIAICETGFSISPRLHRLIGETPGLNTFPKARSLLFLENGLPKPQGTLLKNPELGRTFRIIAQKGSRPFYRGKIAHTLVHAVRHAPLRPGKMSLRDLASYRPIKRLPVQMRIGPYRIMGMPPPSSGGIAISQILKLLELKNIKNIPFGSASFIHLFCQASRLAFADRNYYIADPERVRVPISRLLDPAYLQHRSRLISGHALPRTAFPGQWPGMESSHSPLSFFSYSLGNASTTQLCVVDQEGNAVSLTGSIENAFGSTLMAAGFFLNSELADFSFSPETAANRVSPGKRPMSSMAPTFVFDTRNQELMLVLGSAGGSRIIDYVAQLLLGVLEYELDLQEAIDYPHFTCVDDRIDLEEGTFLVNEADALESLGNTVHYIPLTSGTQAIQRTGEKLIGGADPRREGKAIGE